MLTIPKGYRRLEDSERRRAAGSDRIGPADPSESLSVTIMVRRRPDGPPVPKPQTGAAIPRQEYVAKFGASEDDLKKVADFAKANGLAVTETNAARRTVVATGSVADMSKAFAVDLGRYKSDGNTYRGREGFISVPEELVGIVEGVFGLDNRPIGGRNAAPVALRRPVGRVKPLDNAGGVNVGDPPNTNNLAVPQIVQLYDFPTNSAAGQTIGILEMGGGYKPSDITKFFTSQGLTTPSLTDVSIDGATNSPGSFADQEVVLDICISGAVAQNAAIAVYFAPQSQAGWVDALHRAVHPGAGDPTPSVLSASWYICDGDDSATLALEGVSTAEVTAVDAALLDAANLGMTVFIASGDTGSDSKVGDGLAHVQFPGSDAWSTACGGTTVGNVMGSSFDEIAWNDTFVIEGTTLSGATGGGISYSFGVPEWQNGAGIPTSANPDKHVGRGVPDVAGNASPNSGYNIWLNGSEITGGGNGTSAVAPLYAGLIATINASLGQNVGYLNPLLYALNGTGVIRDIDDGGTNALNGAPGYTCGVGWDACTGLGVADGNALLGALQARFTKSVTIVTDRSTFGEDEVSAMLHVASPAVIQDAFYVTVDGFTPAQLGVTSANPTLAQLQTFAPTFTTSPNISGMSIQVSGFLPELPSLPAQPQRFTFTYNVVFTDTSGFTAPTIPVTITATTHGVSGNGYIELIESPNPFMNHGPISWLSTDLRVFQITPGNSLAGLGSVVMGSDPISFVQGVISGFNGLPLAGHPFDLISTDEQTSKLELSQAVSGVDVYNFAVCRVRMRSLSTDATNVRVFFRMFQASTTSTNYDPNSTYYSATSGLHKIPLLGMEGGELVTIPFFATARVDTSTVAMDTQTDSPNVQTITHDPSGNEIDVYYGAWLDINQPGQLLFPALPPNPDGPFTSGIQSIQSLIRNLHQCLVAEIAYDPDAIPNGVSTGNSDKLSQRNLAIYQSDNPGSPASHRIPDVFQVKATKPVLPKGWKPDELMFDWGNTPYNSEATIYLPNADANEILELAGKMYGLTTLQRVDDHTLKCKTAGVTWLPLPPSADPAYTGLMTVDLPNTVKRGQAFDIVVRQITSQLQAAPPPPPPQPQTQAAARRSKTAAAVATNGNGHAAEITREARRVLGAYQITIPVTTKAHMLVPEERALSVLKWIQEQVPSSDRWKLVFDRYVQVIADRVQALGGDPGKILPSPDGSGVGKTYPVPHPEPHPEPHRRHREDIAFTGKVAGLIYDRFGDFTGFLLDTEDGQRSFESREKDMEEMIRGVWSGRILATVLVDRDRPHHVESVILRSPPARYFG